MKGTSNGSVKRFDIGKLDLLTKMTDSQCYFSGSLGRGIAFSPILKLAEVALIQVGELVNLITGDTSFSQKQFEGFWKTIEVDTTNHDRNSFILRYFGILHKV